MTQINKGDAFIIETPPNGSHLHVVVGMTEREEYLLFTITTSLKREPEIDCIIRPGKGVPEYITQESSIHYSKTRLVRKTNVKRFIRKNEWIPSGNFSVIHVEEFLRKGVKHQFLHKKYKKIVKEIITRNIYINL